MTFLIVFLKMGLIGSPFLGLAALLWVKYHPNPQGVPDADKISRLFERFGVPTILLIFLGFALWKIAQWAKPKADALINTTLAKADALPGLLDENRKANSAQEARDAAIIATMQMAMELTKDLRERVDAQSKRNQLVSESVSALAAEQKINTAAITMLVAKIETLIQMLPKK